MPADGTLWADLSSEERKTVSVCWSDPYDTGGWVVGNNSRGLTATEKAERVLTKGDPASENQKDQRYAVDCMLDWDGGDPRNCPGKYKNWDKERESVGGSSGKEGGADSPWGHGTTHDCSNQLCR